MGKKIIIEKVVINITKSNNDILIEINQEKKIPYHELLGILEMVKYDICLKRLDEIKKNKQEIKK